MREEARICLDCDYIYYVPRGHRGEIVCPRCASRANWPISKWLGAVTGWMEKRLEGRDELTGRIDKAC